jgi:N-acyl homoserine lactone hydrolase
MADAPRLFMFQTGTLECGLQKIKMNTGLGEPYVIPVPWYAIDHPRGIAVIDGGNPVEVATDPVGHWGEAITSGYWPEMTPEEGCVAALEAAGLDPLDVRWLVQSHMHVDHTGALAASASFPNAKVLSSRTEYEYAHFCDDWFSVPSYVDADFKGKDLDWVLVEDIEDGYDLWGDGVLRCWHTPGHSPGHMSFTVTLPETGTYLLAVDAAYTRDHWDEKVLPGFLTSAVEAVRSVRKLHRIAEREEAIVVTGHDPDEWPGFKQAPEFYA